MTTSLRMSTALCGAIYLFALATACNPDGGGGGSSSGSGSGTGTGSGTGSSAAQTTEETACPKEISDSLEKCLEEHVDLGVHPAAEGCQMHLEETHGDKWQVTVSTCGMSYKVRHGGKMCITSLDSAAGTAYALAWTD